MLTLLTAQILAQVPAEASGVLQSYGPMGFGLVGVIVLWRVVFYPMVRIVAEHLPAFTAMSDNLRKTAEVLERTLNKADAGGGAA